MNEDGAKFKLEKQLPAPESGKNLKYSSKKPWTIEGHWNDDAIFKSSRYEKNEDGKWVISSETAYTYKEVMELNGENKIKKFDFIRAFWGPRPAGSLKYKTKKSALQAWENYKMKKEVSENATYYLINKQTGEKIKL